MKQTIILILLSFVFNFAIASRVNFSDTIKTSSKLKLSFDIQLNSIFSNPRNKTSYFSSSDTFLDYDLNSDKLFGLMTGGAVMLEYKNWNLGIHSTYVKTNISYDIYFKDEIAIFRKYPILYHTHSFNLALKFGRIFNIPNSNIKIESGFGLIKAFVNPSIQEGFHISMDNPYEIERYSILVQPNNSLNLGSIGSILYFRVNKVFQFGEIGLNMIYLNHFVNSSKINFHTKNQFLLSRGTLVPDRIFSVGVSFKKYLIQ
jgi:hypothetical protein